MRVHYPVRLPSFFSLSSPIANTAHRHTVTQPLPRLLYLGPLQSRPQLWHHHLRSLPRHPRLFVPLRLHLRRARLRCGLRVQPSRGMLRTGVLDVDVRGECVGSCAGVWCVSVFVARVERARVSPNIRRSCGAGCWSSTPSMMLSPPYRSTRDAL
jgi:hypothetical protein